MENYTEIGDKIAFHPGYYIEEIMKEKGLSQEYFAKELNIEPDTLDMIVRGEQSVSNEIAQKLSEALGSSTEFWLNLQHTYDTLIANKEVQSIPDMAFNKFQPEEVRRCRCKGFI